MFFLVQTLKDIVGHSINSDIVIQGPSEEHIKNFFQYHKVLVLGMREVPGWPRSVSFWAQKIHDDSDYIYCITGTDIYAVYTRLVVLGCTPDSVVGVDHTPCPVDPGQVSAYLSREYPWYIVPDSVDARHHAAVSDDIVDPAYVQIQEVAKQLLGDIDRIAISLPSQMMIEKGKLHDIAETLVKLKMGTNKEKLTNIIQQALTLMENVELQSIGLQKQYEQKAITQSSLSQGDVITEIERYKNSHQSQLVGITKNRNDTFYAIFGLYGIYQKFLYKDIKESITHIHDVYLYLCSTCSLAMHTILTCSGIYIGIYMIFIGPAGYDMYMLLVMIGVWSLWYTVVMACRYHNLVYILCSWMIFVGGGYASLYILTANMAL